MLEFQKTLLGDRIKMTVDADTQKKMIKMMQNIDAVEDNEETKQLASTIRAQVDMMRKQKISPEEKLPLISKSFYNPKIVTHTAGKKTFVANNDAHSKNTNNGFFRSVGA